MYFYVMEKLSDFFTLRLSDLNTTLTYVLIDINCPCLLNAQSFKTFQECQHHEDTNFS